MKPEWHFPALEILDYFIQSVMLLLALVHPWLAPLGRFGRVFAYPLILSFIWCLWRMAIFDPAINNDVPGIGYLVVGFILGVIGVALHGWSSLDLSALKALRQ